MNEENKKRQEAVMRIQQGLNQLRNDDIGLDEDAEKIYNQLLDNMSDTVTRLCTFLVSQNRWL